MKDLFGERSFKRGLKVARELGAECQANPGCTIKEYFEDMVFYSSEHIGKFRDLPKEQQNALIIEFNKGIEAEKKYQ